MLRSILKLATILSGLLVVFVMGVCAMPYDESQLRAFMTASENCTGSCLLGIRPGKMRVADAMEILETHPWVETTRLSASGNGYGQIRWQWNGQQPNVIDDTYAGRITFYWDTEDPNGPSLADTIIQTISIQTYLRMDSLQFWYGLPDSGTAGLRSDLELGYSAGYHDPGTTISLSATMFCPVDLLTYWDARTRITVSIGWGSSTYISPYEMVKMC